MARQADPRDQELEKKFADDFEVRDDDEYLPWTERKNQCNVSRRPTKAQEAKDKARKRRTLQHKQILQKLDTQDKSPAQAVGRKEELKLKMKLYANSVMMFNMEKVNKHKDTAGEDDALADQDYIKKIIGVERPRSVESLPKNVIRPQLGPPKSTKLLQ